MSALVKADLPEVGDRRFWVVKHRAHRTEPVVVELRQSFVESRSVVSLSTLLGFEYTVADAEAIKEAAKLVEARVGNIDNVVGVY